MSKYTGSVCKLCRRAQTKLFLKGEKCYTKCVLDKRRSLPGPQRGRAKKPSEYALRLTEKQKLKRMAYMTEIPFELVFQRASKSKTQTGEELLKLLELRLDNVVRRLGFTLSLKTARQWVLHGHVRINGEPVNIPSYTLKLGDRVSLDPALKENPQFKQAQEALARQGNRPSFYELHPEQMEGKLLRHPTREEMSFPVQEQLVVEYYSK